MANVLTVGSSLQCAHLGKFILVGSQKQLTVDGQAVLVDGDLENASISGCTTPTAQGTKPCLKVTGVLGGKSTTLSVGGKAVLLDNAAGTTDGLPVAPQQWSVASAAQTKLQAD
jgi:hypothetical protein